jgi:hypothetical protein
MKNKFETIIFNLDNLSDLEDEEILMLKEKFKEIESKLKIKPKSISISGEAHNIIKKHCLKLGDNIGEWCEKMLIKSISTLTPFTKQPIKGQEEYIEYLIKGFNESLPPDSSQTICMMNDNERKLLEKFYLFLESNNIVK